MLKIQGCEDKRKHKLFTLFGFSYTFFSEICSIWSWQGKWVGLWVWWSHEPIWNADDKRKHSPYPLTWILLCALCRKGSLHLCGQWQTIIELSQSTDPALLMDWHLKGADKWFLVLFPWKRKLMLKFRWVIMETDI